jgi:predicted DNA-binding transcriptional regulator AlpA
MHVIENIDRNNFVGEPLLSHDAAAKALGVSRATLYRMRQAGIGPRHRKVSRYVTYPQSAIVEYLAAVTTPANYRGAKKQAA